MYQFAGYRAIDVGLPDALLMDVIVFKHFLSV